MIKKLERRIHTLPSGQKFEVRANADGTRTVSGYAAVFNSLSKDLGNFRERIQPGAFKQTLTDNPDVFLLYAHSMDNVPLGRTKASTLSLREDSNGLAFKATLPNTQLARDLAVSMERGDVDAMSFGFCVPPNGDDWQQTDDGLIRTLRSVMLSEISIVPMPAYNDTTVNIRSCPPEFRSALGTDVIDFDTTDDEADDDPDSDDDIDPVTGKKRKKKSDDDDEEEDQQDDDPGLDIGDDSFDSLRCARLAQELRRAVIGY